MRGRTAPGENQCLTDTFSGIFIPPSTRYYRIPVLPPFNLRYYRFPETLKSLTTERPATWTAQIHGNVRTTHPSRPIWALFGRSEQPTHHRPSDFNRTSKRTLHDRLVRAAHSTWTVRSRSDRPNHLTCGSTATSPAVIPLCGRTAQYTPVLPFHLTLAENSRFQQTFNTIANCLIT